jgi:hypothetical protein
VYVQIKDGLIKIKYTYFRTCYSVGFFVVLLDSKFAIADNRITHIAMRIILIFLPFLYTFIISDTITKVIDLYITYILTMRRLNKYRLSSI